MRKRATGRPRGASGQGTRARILLAARRAFSAGGYAATTVQDVADAVGLTPAAIYRYFESKPALYLATVRDANGVLLEEYRRALGYEHTGRDGLRALLFASADLNKRDPTLAPFLSALPVEMKRNPELAAAMANEPSEIVDLFSHAVDLSVRSGELPRGRGGDVLALFVACSMGLSLYASAVGGDVRAIIQAFVDLIDGKLFRSRKR